jgi:hypothetical protein
MAKKSIVQTLRALRFKVKLEMLSKKLKEIANIIVK